MAKLSRRGLIGSIGAATVARQRSARAAGTVVMWWNQGFYEAENKAVLDIVAQWEKASGNKVQLTFLPVTDVTAKIVSGMTMGDVPDLIYSDTGQNLIVPQAAWNDKLVDVSNVVDTQKGEFLQSALDSAHFYNNTLKQRSYYGVPIKGATLMEEVWRPMIEEAGYKDADVPTTQDKYFDFFEDVQKKLRAKGERIYGLGYSMATTEADSGNLFHSFLEAYGGDAIVSLDGKRQADDPKVRQAAIIALERLTTPFKQGYVPPGAINWGDVDNNNAFYAKQIVMTPNATISIAVAQMDKHDQYYNEILTQGTERERRHTGAEPAGRAAVLHHQRCEERRWRQGVFEVLHRASAAERLPEAGPRALDAGDAVGDQIRSVVDGPVRSAPSRRGAPGTDHAESLMVPDAQSSLCRGQCHAGLGAGRGRHYAGGA
jgi:multiple sugar transport system substrate-binding protein